MPDLWAARFGKILNFGELMKKLLIYFSIALLFLVIWYFRGMPEALKKPIGKIIGWVLLMLWLYLVFRYGSFRFS